MVRDSAQRLAVPGAVLTILDSTGASLGRVTSDAGGRFAMARPPHAAKIRAVRIGYRPRELALAAAADTLEIVMTRLPPMLATVRVTGAGLCPGASGGSEAVELWEQAKAGLLAAVVARDTRPARVRSLIYERTTTTNDERVTDQTARIAIGYSNRPFVAAAEASYFARVGFMQEDSQGRLYSAPDADVLLDDAFAATHCFHIQGADREHPDQIGLAFEPAPGSTLSRGHLVDVTGVIWIDRITPQIRSLDFRYTALEPAAMRVGSGGHLDFHTMANGVAFVQRWRLRTATLIAQGRLQIFRFGFPGDRASRTSLQVGDLRESGGIVLDAQWPDTVAWHEAPSGIAGSVTQLRTRLPVAAAVVTLEGTNSVERSADDGSFELAPIVPGRYMLVITDTTLSDLAEPRTTRLRIEISSEHITNIRAELPSLTDVIRDLCHDQRIPDGTSMLIGRVQLAGGERPRGRVVARWQANYNNGSPVTAKNDVARPVAVNGAEQHVDLDDQGHFAVCGVARGRPVQLRYMEGERVADTTVVIADSLLKSVDWRVVLPPKPNPFAPSVIERDEPIEESRDVVPGAGESSNDRRTRGPLAEPRKKSAAR